MLTFLSKTEHARNLVRICTYFSHGCHTWRHLFHSWHSYGSLTQEVIKLNIKTVWLFVRKQIVLTEQTALVGEVSVNFPTFVIRGCCVVSTTDPYSSYSRFPRLEVLLIHWRSSWVILTRLHWPRSRPTATQKIWHCQESNSGSLTTRTQRQL
jgi:hypothetical protein